MRGGGRGAGSMGRGVGESAHWTAVREGGRMGDNTEEVYGPDRAERLLAMLRALAERIRELDRTGRLLERVPELQKLLGNARSELFHYEVRLTYDTPEIAESRRIVEEAERLAREAGGEGGEGGGGGHFEDDEDGEPWRGVGDAGRGSTRCWRWWQWSGRGRCGTGRGRGRRRSRARRLPSPRRTGSAATRWAPTRRGSKSSSTPTSSAPSALRSRRCRCR